MRIAKRMVPVVGVFLLGVIGLSPARSFRSPGESPRAPLAAAADPIPGDDWMGRVQRQLAEREYRASESGEGLQAPNRRHNLRTYFEPTGIRVHDRTAAGSPRLLSLSFGALGRGDRLIPVSAGELASSGARVEIRRPDLTEWYVNSPSGLEQGFTVARRPPGNAENLMLELAVDGATASLRGDQVILATSAGRRLAYDALVVEDANGTRVAARFEVPDASHVRLVVADARAQYPLTIDPLLTETADSQLESDQASSHLGYSVAAAGDVDGNGYADVVVGAYQYDAGQSDEGAAFVFLGSAAGVADGSPGTAAAQLESNQSGGLLGFSVSGAGDVNGDGYADVIVGAPGYSAGQSREGAAFVFLGSAAGIADGNPSTAAAQLESDQVDAELGDSVSGAGDVNGDGFGDVIVGARYFDAGQTDEGAAFVFLGSASGIADGNPATTAAQLESDQGLAQLGIGVTGAGDVNGDGYGDVIIGAYHYDAGQGFAEGAAFVFLGSASGIADGNPSTAATQLESDQANAELGIGVSEAGDVNGDGYGDVVVGAPRYDAGAVDEGAAFVFLGSAAGIADGNPATAAAQLESNQANAWFGRSVFGAGDVNGDGYADVIAGAPSYDAGQTDEGAAFVFLGGAGGIADGNPTTAATQLESNQAGAELGVSIAGAGDVNGDGYADVIVGARYFDAGQTDAGAAFVFLGGAEGIADGDPTTAATQLEPGQAYAQLGFSLGGAGDVNGDGYADVIVGAPYFDAGQTNEGAAFVFSGSPAGIADGNSATAAAQLESDQPGALLGSGVAGAGDVNGDGYADVIVSAAWYDAGQTDEGAAFVFLGGAGGIADGNPTTAATQLESDQAGARLGFSLGGAGDVNGDGFADVIVGADQFDAGQTNEGAAFVFLGSAMGIADGNPATAAAQLEPDQASSALGFSVAGAGDVNGDGYADVIVGAPQFNSGNLGEGAAFVFLGSALGIVDGSPATAAAQLESNQTNAFLGCSVAGAGDMNGDGYADVIVGVQQFDAAQSDSGAAFVFRGSAAGIADGSFETAAAVLYSNQASSILGSSVAAAGDVNGDGYADVIVGAPRFDAGQTDEGAAFVFLGSAAGNRLVNQTAAAAQLESNQISVALGTSVAGAGDVNGDGYADVIVGSPFFDAGQGTAGSAFVFLGNGDGDGRPVVARQLRSDGSGTPVQPWGWSGSLNEGAFEVRMRATHPLGRGRVKLEVETCAEGVAFGNSGCTHRTGASWIDATGTTGGVELIEHVGGLQAGTLYRWRARVLHAPSSVTTFGITPPPRPAHGPWRRVSGQAVEADILPEPSMTVVLGSGISLLVAFHRRRRGCGVA